MKVTANRLTLLRILLIPLPCVLLYGGPTAKLTALGITSLIGLTDYLDGKLARRQGVTRLGKLLDPIADKIFVTVFYLFLVHIKYIPLWIVLLILFREFLVTSLRFIVPDNLPVSWLAKLKTSVQMIAAGLIVIAQAFPSWRIIGLLLASLAFILGVWVDNFSMKQRIGVTLGASLFPLLVFFPSSKLPLILGGLVIIFTWVSGASYLKRAWSYVKGKESVFSLGGSLLLPTFLILLMPLAGNVWSLVPLALIGELIRQALKIILGRSETKDFIWGFLGIWALFFKLFTVTGFPLTLFLILVVGLESFSIFKFLRKARYYFGE